MPSRSTTVSSADIWSRWLKRWDTQQTGYLPDREGRFDIMRQAVTTLCGSECRILDLACGPASLSQRLLGRHSGIYSVGLDYDPVLLELGRRAYGDFGGRLQLVHADIGDPGWVSALPSGLFDAVLTTTALHWLTADQLATVYRQLNDLVPAGGLVLNGDHMAYPQTSPTVVRLAETLKKERRNSAFVDRGVEDYNQWWSALETFSNTQEEHLQLPFAQRRAQSTSYQAEKTRPGHSLHVSALQDAGFAEVDTIWSNLDNRVLIAVK